MINSFKANARSEWSKFIKDGRTLIFVSDGAAQVQEVCRRAVFLQQGKIMFDGAVNDALTAYAESVKQEVEDRHQHTPPRTRAIQ